MNGASARRAARGAVYGLGPIHGVAGGDGMPDKGPGSKSGGKKPKGGTKAGGGKKKK